MSSIRYNAAQSFASFLQPLIGDVPVFAGQQPYESDTVFPSVAILPRKHRYVPIVYQEINIDNASHLLTKAGTMDGTVELRVYATTASDRELIEQRITEAFHSQSPLRPGIVVLETAPFNYGGISWPNKALVAYELGDEDWQEEMVFSDKRYSFINLTSQYEVFISHNIGNINEIDVIIKDFNNNLIAQFEVFEGEE